MIKNVIFDMGGVLLDWNPQKLVDTLDLPQEDRDIIRTRVFDSFRWCLLDFGYYCTEEEFMADVSSEIPERLVPSARKLVCGWDSIVFEQVAGMSEIVHGLKKNGYHIYLLSNAGPRHKEYWKKFDFADLFDGVVVSNYERMYKPGTEIFKLILTRYNLDADESIFIDDRAENCAGAYIAGIHPVKFTDAESLKKDFDRLQIKY